MAREAKSETDPQKKDPTTEDLLRALQAQLESQQAEIQALKAKYKRQETLQKYQPITAFSIITATKNNDLPAVKAFIEAEVQLNTAYTKGAALHWAASKGFTKIATALIDAKAKLNTTDKDGATALHRAASKGFTKIATALIDAKAKLNTTDKDGYTALHWAAVKGHTQIATALIVAKAELNITTKNGYTALHLAAEKGHTQIATALIDAGAELNTTDENNGATALHWAAEKGHTQIATALIDAKADLNTTDENNGATALHWAADEGHTQIATALIDAKADLNTTAKNGATALHWAAMKGQIAIATALIDAGAELNTTPKNGYTALHLAAVKGHTQIATALIDAKAELNTTDKNRATALILAAKKGHAEIVELLVKSGADIGAKGTYFSPNPISAKATGSTKALCQNRPALLALRYEGFYERTLAKNKVEFPEAKASSNNDTSGSFFKELKSNFLLELKGANKTERDYPIFQKLQKLTSTDDLLTFYSTLEAFYLTYKDEESYKMMTILPQCVGDSLLTIKVHLKGSMICPSDADAQKNDSTPKSKSIEETARSAAGNSSPALKNFGQFKASASGGEEIPDTPGTSQTIVSPPTVGLTRSLNQ